MKRSLLVTALTLALLVLLSGAALATGKPVRVFIGGPLDVPVANCAFPVTQHILTNNEYILIFTGDHPAIVTGSLKAFITNDATGKGIYVNISGPAFITANADGSTTIYFGPKKPSDVKEGNWIQTVPGKGWFTLLRLCGPLEPFFTKEWRLSEIEKVQ